MLEIEVFKSLKLSSKHIEYNLHHINNCFNIALPFFTHTNLVYVNINIGIFIFKRGTLSKRGLRTQCVNSNKYGKFYVCCSSQEKITDHLRLWYPEVWENWEMFHYYQEQKSERDPELTRKLAPDSPTLDQWVADNKDAFKKRLDWETAIPVYNQTTHKGPVNQIKWGVPTLKEWFNSMR